MNVLRRLASIKRRAKQLKVCGQICSCATAVLAGLDCSAISSSIRVPRTRASVTPTVGAALLSGCANTSVLATAGTNPRAPDTAGAGAGSGAGAGEGNTRARPSMSAALHRASTAATALIARPVPAPPPLSDSSQSFRTVVLARILRLSLSLARARGCLGAQTWVVSTLNPTRCAKSVHGS